MLFIKQKIPELILIEPQVYTDERGYFSETFHQDLFEQSVGHKVFLYKIMNLNQLKMYYVDCIFNPLLFHKANLLK